MSGIEFGAETKHSTYIYALYVYIMNNVLVRWAVSKVFCETKQSNGTVKLSC